MYIFLGVRSPAIHKINTGLVALVNPIEKLRQKYFENVPYVPHLTLGETRYSTSGLSKDNLRAIETRAKHELINLPPFDITFARVFQQAHPDKPYTTFLDIPFRT